MNRVIRARAAIGCTKYTILGFLGSLIVLASLHAQTATKEPGNANTTAAAPSTPVAGQAPEDVTRKMTDLVNARRYAEAQALTTGLLVAYPNDQRLIKTQVLLKQLLASAAAGPSTANGSPRDRRFENHSGPELAIGRSDRTTNENPASRHFTPELSATRKQSRISN